MTDNKRTKHFENKIIEKNQIFAQKHKFIRTGGLFDDFDGDSVATPTTTRYTTTTRTTTTTTTTTEAPTTSAYYDYTTKGFYAFFNNNNPSSSTTIKYNAPITKWAGFFNTPSTQGTPKAVWNPWNQNNKPLADKSTPKSAYNQGKYTWSTTKSPFDFSNFHQTYNNNKNSAGAVDKPAAAAAATTRSSVFDIYLKRKASTTRNPYDFADLKYFKSTTQNPNWAYNYFGANSETANVTVA
jgi:hypothetical protein